jgi:hypothetical protein
MTEGVLRKIQKLATVDTWLRKTIKGKDLEKIRIRREKEEKALLLIHQCGIYKN